MTSLTFSLIMFLLPPLLRSALQRDDGQHGVDGRDDCGRRGRSLRQLSPLASDQSRRGVDGVDGGRGAQGVGAHSAVSQQQLGADEYDADAE